MADVTRIGEQEIAPGTKQVVRLPVTQDLDGGEINVWVHVIRGVHPGPTLGLFGVQHGNKWFPLEMLRQAIEEMDPQQMSGTILAVPVCNPIALGAGRRITQPDSDCADLNAVWPGIHTWISDALAKVISREVLRCCDALLDFHFGQWGTAFRTMVYATDYPEKSLGERCHEIAMAFGPPCLQRGKVLAPPSTPESGQVPGAFPGSRSLRGYAGNTLGIPALTVEIGGLGYGKDVEQGWIQEVIRGIRNVMRHLKILDEPIEKRDRIMLVTSRTMRINPSIGGLMIPVRDPEDLLREVKEGEVLGRVISPYTFETLELLQSPFDGHLVYAARIMPVRPGDYTFGVFEKSGVQWITQ